MSGFVGFFVWFVGCGIVLIKELVFDYVCVVVVFVCVLVIVGFFVLGLLVFMVIYVIVCVDNFLVNYGVIVDEVWVFG